MVSSNTKLSLENTTNEQELKEIIHNLLQEYKKNHLEEYRVQILALFVRFTGKKGLKKFLLSKCRQENIIAMLVQQSTSHFQRKIHDKSFFNEDLFGFLQFLYVIQTAGHFPVDSEELFQFFIKVLKEFFMKIWSSLASDYLERQVMASVNLVAKLLLCMVINLPKEVLCFPEVLCIIRHEHVTFDLKTKCGLIFAHFTNLNERKIVELLTEDNVSFATETNRLILISTLLSVVEPYLLTQITIKEDILFVYLFKQLVSVAERVISNPPEIIEASRLLSILAKDLHKAPSIEQKTIFSLGLSFVWLNGDHFVDTVRNYTKCFMSHLICWAIDDLKKGGDLMDILLKDIKNMGPNAIALQSFEMLAEKLSFSFVEDKFPRVVSQLLSSTSDVSVGEQATKTYLFSMKANFFEGKPPDSWRQKWIDPVLKKIYKTGGPTPNEQRILVGAAVLDYKALQSSLSEFSSDKEDYLVVLQFNLLLKWLPIARHKSNEEDNAQSTLWRGIIEKERLLTMKKMQNEEIRVSLLMVLVETNKTTEPFTGFELDLILDLLHSLVTTQSAHLKKLVVSYYKKALARIKASKRKVEDPQIYCKFLSNFTRTLLDFLTCDSNHFRRTISLELLLLDGVVLEGVSQDDQSNLMNILHDTYECNKQLVVCVLRLLPISTDFQAFLQRALQLAADLRPSSTLTASYMLELCSYNCEKFQETNSIFLMQSLIGLIKVESSLDLNELKNANYGLFLSLRNLIRKFPLKEMQVLQNIFTRIIEVCWALRAQIMPIVCSPSPEGYLPDNNDLIDESSRAQTIVVYAWRVMKEMTLLLAELTKITIQLESTNNLISNESLKEIGEFFVQIFLESKHRGVFEQAYVGFSMICESFWTSDNQQINGLPKKWLGEVLEFFDGRRDSTRLCSTRRSAGLPFLVLSILSVEPTLDRASFLETMTILFKVCEGPETEEANRMHCLNVLRAIFRHSKLGEVVAPFVARGVIVAITGFKSTSWGIRNSSTLLFASLMTRMFGVQRTHDSTEVCLKNRLTVRVFFMRYPALYNFLLRTLEEECKLCNSLVLHPVLLILTRLYGWHVKEHHNMEKYWSLILVCMSSKEYCTRQLAAKALLPLVLKDKVDKFCQDYSSNIATNYNQMHGTLLVFYDIIRTMKINHSTMIQFIKEASKVLETNWLYSHLLLTLYMDITVLILQKHKPVICDKDLKKLIRVLGLKSLSQNIVSTSSTLVKSRFNLLTCLVLNYFEDDDLTKVVLQEVIQNVSHGQPLIKQHTFEFLLYLNHSVRKLPRDQPLIFAEEIEISSDTISLINSISLTKRVTLLKILHPPISKFLLENISLQTTEKTPNLTLMFLLLRFYDCVMVQIDSEEDKVLKKLIELCHTKNVELKSSILSCLNSFLQSCSSCTLKHFNFTNLTLVLKQASCPSSPAVLRLGVAELLTENQRLFFDKSPILKDDCLRNWLGIALVLLEDEELEIRNSMLNTRKSAPIPDVLKHELLEFAAAVFDKPQALSFIFSWSCRHFPDTSNDLSQIFERGEANLFAENIPIRAKSIELLTKLLSSFQSNEEKRLFFIESLQNNACETILEETKQILIETLVNWNESDFFLNLERSLPQSDFLNIKIVLKSLLL